MILTHLFWKKIAYSLLYIIIKAWFTVFVVNFYAVFRSNYFTLCHVDAFYIYKKMHGVYARVPMRQLPIQVTIYYVQKYGLQHGALAPYFNKFIVHRKTIYMGIHWSHKHSKNTQKSAWILFPYIFFVFNSLEITLCQIIWAKCQFMDFFFNFKLQTMVSKSCHYSKLFMLNVIRSFIVYKIVDVITDSRTRPKVYSNL